MQALSGLTNYERTRADGPRAFDLSRPRALLARLGAPHHDLGARVVQIAGTKGKGSTARCTEAILRAAGLKTGLFLSPHLESVLERIQVDGRKISEADFAQHVEQVVDAMDGETTFFEALLAAACLHFRAQQTQAVVLEVGLGGRLDATTAVPSTHTIITEISFEHTEILGDTLGEIAAEKAGTIRFGVPVFSGVDPMTPAGRVIGQIAARQEAPLNYVPPPRDVIADENGLRLHGVPLNTLGRHQAHNAALAAAACADLGTGTIERGLMAAAQPGCCERFGNVILDGAHTPSSVRATLQAVHDHFPQKKPQLVIAIAKDKDLHGIAALVAPCVQQVFCTQVDHRRGRTSEELAAHPIWRDRACAMPDPATALKQAKAAAGPRGLVLATGSLYLAGALRSIVGRP